jgi:hypothetical protein
MEEIHTHTHTHTRVEPTEASLREWVDGVVCLWLRDGVALQANLKISSSIFIKLLLLILLNYILMVERRCVCVCVCVYIYHGITPSTYQYLVEYN